VITCHRTRFFGSKFIQHALAPPRTPLGELQRHRKGKEDKGREGREKEKGREERRGGGEERQPLKRIKTDILY